MNISDIAHIRLANQNISSKKFKRVKDLVSYMGAVQAQDYVMAKWAIGVRLENATEQSINTALDNGDIFRTHLLRPTLHFVSAEDITWMLELTAPRIKALMKSRNKQLGLTQSIYNRSNNIIKKALAGGNYLTREELITLLQKAKIKTDNNRASHLLMEAELDGVICSGKLKGNKQTYALLKERVSNPKYLSNDEMLPKLAKIYFKSRGPATVHDFVWWSGLTLTKAREALDMISAELTSVEIDSQIYWFSNTFTDYQQIKESAYLLPTYDEYIISYKNRTAVIDFEGHRRIISTNGIFRALIVINGVVTGIWKKTIKNDAVIMEMNYFKPPNNKMKSLIEQEALRFGRFLDKKIELFP